MKHDKYLVIPVFHISTILFVFLIGMYTAQIIMPLEPDLVKSPVFSSVISQTKGNYTTEEAIIGFFIFVFFLPLNLSIVYHISTEMASKGDIYNSIEKGFMDYPMFFMGFSSVFFFSLVFPAIVPLIIYAAFRRLEPKVPWKYHVLSTILFISWLIPIALTNRIESILWRRSISFIFLMALFIPFIGHATMIDHVLKKK